jgi:hypothetical protein
MEVKEVEIRQDKRAAAVVARFKASQGRSTVLLQVEEANK